MYSDKQIHQEVDTCTIISIVMQSGQVSEGGVTSPCRVMFIMLDSVPVCLLISIVNSILKQLYVLEQIQSNT